MDENSTKMRKCFYLYMFLKLKLNLNKQVITKLY